MSKKFFSIRGPRTVELLVAHALTIILTMFATAVLSYVSLAVMVGPWIDPTLALCGLGMISVCSWLSWTCITRSTMLLIVAAASMGGLIGSAAVWSFPTLYFLDTTYFISLLQEPAYFMTGIAMIVLAAGSVGLLVVRCTPFIWRDTQHYAFPIAQLVVRTITVFGNIKQLVLLGVGALTGVFFHAAQLIKHGIPQVVSLVKGHSVNSWLCIPQVMVNMNVAPMLWAVGFIAGNILVVPLFVGMLLKIVLMEPCYRMWFAVSLTEQNFATAFCTGIIIQGTMHSFWKLFTSWHRPSSYMSLARFMMSCMVYYSSSNFIRSIVLPALWTSCFVGLVLRCVAGLSWLSIVYVMVASVICSYQLILLMGRIGLAPLGRFATFVMVPGLLVFRFNSLQATVVAAFVELAGAVATTAASGMRISMATDRADTDEAVQYYQKIALFCSAIFVAIIIWLFARYFGFGIPPLIAQRAQSRALLISAHEMNVSVLGLGIVVGFILHAININTTLLLGGILMSLSDTLMLIIGGALSHLCNDPKKFEPFWSGIFTASSLWMMSRIVFQ